MTLTLSNRVYILDAFTTYGSCLTLIRLPVVFCVLHEFNYNFKVVISERINIVYMCTYKSLVISAKTLEIIIISDYQAYGLLLWTVVTDVINNFLTRFPLLCI